MIIFLECNAQIKNDPGVVFNTTLHQFGSIERGSNAEFVFSFINKSNTPVVLTNVKTFCGCLELTWTKEPVKPE